MKVKELIKELRQRHPESVVLLKVTPFENVKSGEATVYPLWDIMANDRIKAGRVLLTSQGSIYGDE
jgi:hypothetical protein